MRTNGRLLMDTSMPDGQLFYSPADIMSSTSAATIVRASKGLIAAVAPASTTTIFPVCINDLLRYGMSDDAQQQFGQGTPQGGFQGAQGQATTLTTPFTTPYGPTGRPPYLQATQFAPVLSRPKGLAINSVMPWFIRYSVLILRASSCGSSKTIFASGVAPVVTDVIVPGANGLSTSHLVGAPVTTSVLNPVQNSFFTTAQTELIAEIQFVAPAGSTVNFYGMFVNVAFNFN